MTRACFLYNPAVGRFPLTRKRLAVLRERLYRLGIRTEVTCTKAPDRGATSLDLEGQDLLLIYGGDGTIHDVLGEAVKWKIPVGILPAGTANVLARELGIPRHLEKAVDVVAAGTPARMTLGRAGPHHFHLMAGIGVDGYILQKMRSGMKKTFGVASYWMLGFQSFWSLPLRPFEVRFPDRSYRATFAVVSNCRRYGGHLLITPRASVFEDALDVCLFTSTNRSRFLRYLFGALTGRHVQYADVVYRKARRVGMHGDPAIPVQLDGDVVGHLPMDFTTCSDAIQVIVPPARRLGGQLARPEPGPGEPATDTTAKPARP
ncbi:MAG: diacylglycerol/lipid kinase family protein [Acidobacteriota bacterium]